MPDNISVFYSRVTDVPTFGTAYHMTLVYTNSSGQSFYASAGPTQAAPADTGTASSALNAASNGGTSPYGTLTVRVSQFDPSDSGNKITFDDSGNQLASRTLLSGDDLSGAWGTISQTYNNIAALGIPYAPTSQNSNSVAGTALRSAGMDVPFDKWAPGQFLKLPTNQDELQQFNGGRSENETDNPDGSVTLKYTSLGLGENDTSIETIKNGILDSGVENYNTSSGINLVASGETVNLTEDNANIIITEGTLANIYGRNDNINLQANNNETIGVTGQNLLINGDNGNDVVNLNADTSATVDGGGYAGIVGDNATLTFGDGGSSLQTTPGVTNETVNGSNLSITLNANVQMTINGSNDTINGMAGQDNVTINGSYNSFSGTNDQVNLEGDEGSDTETGQNNSYFSNGTYTGGSDPSGGVDDPGDPGDDGDDDDPLVLNLRGGSVDTVDAAHSPARFDFHPNGRAVQTGWGTPGEGYLVDAANGQTTIRDGRDLVSSFMSLQKLDSNHDDRIDAKDAHWNDLKVWVDKTGTATSQPGSLLSLSDLGITSIDLDPTPDRHRQNGNLILSEGTFTRRDGSTGQIADVDFRTNGGSPQPETAGSPGAAVNLQASTQAAQLVSAMSTFGAKSTAETSVQGTDRPALIPMGVDASHPSHRHAP